MGKATRAGCRYDFAAGEELQHDTSPHEVAGPESLTEVSTFGNLAQRTPLFYRNRRNLSGGPALIYSHHNERCVIVEFAIAEPRDVLKYSCPDAIRAQAPCGKG
jgi:hypothetical protein